MIKNKTALRLCESAMMLAASTLLSFLKLVDLPAGGSITLASLLPIIIIAYRYGTSWGLLCGIVHGVIQLVSGASVLSYVTGAASVCAVILLDYVLAFAAAGLGGAFRSVAKNQSAAFILGAIAVSLLRYICHVISGCTVWAGLSIPTASALNYSFIYNATYMLPEMLILIVVSYYVSSSLDFSSQNLAAAKKGGTSPVSRILSAAAGATLSAAIVYDVVAVFSKLQNPESGEFDVTAIGSVAWDRVIIISAVAVLVALVFVLAKRVICRSK